MPVVALAASQAGHLLALQLRQGPGTVASAGSGTHVYVPALATLALGAAGALALAALLVVAAARVARAGRGRAAARVRLGRVVDLAAALFAVQLTIFAVQETVEAAAAQRPPLGVAQLLVWGVVGQLPVSVVAALVLSWLGARFEWAVVEVAAAAGAALAGRPALPPVRQWRPARVAPRPPQAAGALTLRGPPRPLRHC
jgi:hypothetical protein